LIVDDTVQAPAGFGDMGDGGVDVGLHGHVETHGLDVFYRVELGEIGVLAGARVDEVAVPGQHLGDLAADAGACAGHQDGFPGLRLLGRAGLGDDAQRADQQAEEEREREELVHECSLQSVAGTLPCDVRAGGSWVLT
jgi:hypothetical protein